MPRIVGLLDKRIVVVTGKGGVGKTTVSLALGLAAARAGKRVIVCEVSSQENAARIFDRPPIGFNEVELRKNLWAISIDPDHSMREYLELQLPVKAMSDLLYKSRVFNYLAAATPGLREMVTIGKIWELALETRKKKRATPYDVVIVDAPATGHGVGFLQTPRTFAEIARVGPMSKQAARIDATLTDPNETGVAIVALPEEMPVNESAKLERDLIDDVGICVDAVYMNAVFPERFSKQEIKQIEAARGGADGSAEVALSAAVDQSRRAAAHREQLDRLRELVQTPVSELPYAFSPKLGPAQIQELSEAFDG